MMRNALWAVVALIFVTISASAFLGDAMQQRFGDLGPKLDKAVMLTGEILAEIARPSADDLIRNRDQILKRLRDLRDETMAISQLLEKMQETRAILSLRTMEATKRTNLLQLVPPEARADVEKNNEIDMKALLLIFSPIKSDVQQDLSLFGAALSEIKQGSDMAAVNKVGRTRGALIASSGRLTEFIGLVQVMAYVQ